MQYYVIGPDGSKYGPADVATLKQWAAENRLQPDSMLEDFGSGQRMPASAVAGLFENQAPTTTAPTTTATPGDRNTISQSLPSGASGPSLYDSPVGNMAPGYYERQGNSEGGKIWLIFSWISSAIGILTCCPYIFSVFSILGIVFAFVAEKQGSDAKAAKIFGFVSLVLTIVISVAFGVLARNILQSLGTPPRVTP